MEKDEDFEPGEPWDVHLRKLRDLFSDEIPDRVVHGGGRYKVRKTWFNGVIGSLELGLLSGDISDPELRDKVQKFINYCQSELSRKSLTEKKDIDWADKIINMVLGSKEMS